MNIRTRRMALLVPAVAALLGMTGEPTSVVPAPREDAGAIARQDQLVAMVREATGPVPVLFVGDSITQGWNDPGKATWDAMIAPLGAMNLGNSGDRTENVLWRLQQAPLTKLAPRAIVLLIGTNNVGHGKSNAAETLAGIQRVVSVLRAQCPEAKIVLMSVFPRGEHINAMRGDLLQVNQALAADPKPAVTLVDIGTRFIDANGDIRKDLMPDSLHLSPAGYRIWAESVLPLVSAPADKR